MSKRPTAALASLLMLASVLTVLPLATAEPASAHPKTVRRCAYDPFAGNQCWNESVRHYHTPVQRNICPPGQTGTWPNCSRPDTPAERENKDVGTRTEADEGTGSGGDNDAEDNNDDNSGTNQSENQDSGPDSGPSGTKGTRSNRDTGNQNNSDSQNQNDDSKDKDASTGTEADEGSGTGSGGDSGTGDNSDDGSGTGAGTDQNENQDSVSGTSGSRGTRSNRDTGSQSSDSQNQDKGKSELRAWISGAWSGLKKGVSWFVDGQGKVAESQRETIDAQREALNVAAKKVLAGLEQGLKDLSESERQRVNADIAAVRSVMQGWQELPPDAQIIISGGACGYAGAAVSGGIAAGAFGGACAYLGHQFGKAELPKLIPPGWTPPGDSENRNQNNGGNQGDDSAGNQHQDNHRNQSEGTGNQDNNQSQRDDSAGGGANKCLQGDEVCEAADAARNAWVDAGMPQTGPLRDRANEALTRWVCREYPSLPDCQS